MKAPEVKSQAVLFPELASHHQLVHQSHCSLGVHLWWSINELVCPDLSHY